MHQSVDCNSIEDEVAKLICENDVITLSGQWCWQTIDESIIEKLPKNIEKSVNIDGKNITKLDTTGAFFINKLLNNNLLQNLAIDAQFTEEHQKILDIIHNKNKFKLKKVKQYQSVSKAYRVGYSTTKYMLDFLNLINFIGLITVDACQKLRRPSFKNFSSTIDVIGSAGLQGIGICCLLSFLIGVVLCYQMGGQLMQYGASIFIVNLLGISLLREFAPLITAIIVAGRSGSAFAAQIGTMKVQEEIDALKTFGISPISRLVMPRIIGLCIALPLLVVLADIASMFGGMVMSNLYLGISFNEFVQELGRSFSTSNYVIGLIKTPFFAIIISTVGCYRGLMVQGNAASIGEETTKSVVYSIFLIIIIDALFSIIFSSVGV
ncbi:MAG: phospholipid/cholesterol/gamma-HCH transport system permease protein [Francisellaceae bacterium]|jgi:phospholipid/cholesterol/gamma-HCH transport system permease protein